MSPRIFIFTLSLLFGFSAAAADPARLDALNALLDRGERSIVEAEILELAATYPQNHEVRYLLGRNALLKGDGQTGVEILESLVRDAPANARYVAALGSAYGARVLEVNLLHKATLVGKIKRQYRRAIELDRTLPEPWFGLIEFYLQAPGIVGGSRKKARELAAEFSTIDPYHGNLARARIDFHEEAYDRALLHLRKAVKINPQDRNGHFALIVLANNRKQFDLALNSINILLERIPDDLPVLYQLGKFAAVSARELERGAQALQRFLKAEARPANPSHAAARWRLGMIRENQGRWEAAATQYQKALELNPDLVVAREALAVLQASGHGEKGSD